MPILAPFEAFARDATALNVDEDESRLPIRWLAAAQVATRLADARPSERKSLLKVWTKQQDAEGQDGVWSALSVPGIHVHDMPTAAAAMCAIASDMERGGALNLAYSTVTHMRIALMDRGPASARGRCTVQQARVLRQMGLLEEAQDTYEAALEDGVRAKDAELEGWALIGLSIVAGHRGNYPDVTSYAKKALAALPATHEFVFEAHTSLMIAAMRARDFASAFQYGWSAYDVAGSNAERRTGATENLASLALRCGQLAAARKGFMATLGATPPHRIQLPALGGLAMTCAATNDVAELRRVADAITRATKSSPLPYEVASVHLELAQSWEQTGELEKAEQCVTRGRDLAAQHGFHEVTFRSDLLAEAIAAAKTRSYAGSDRIESAIARFDELTIDEGVLAPA